MKNIFFTVGPSQLFPTIKKHIKSALEADICSISHRGEKFQEIYKKTTNNLKELLGIPESWSLFFLSSATEAMERILENCAKEHSFHFIGGAFGKRFFEISAQLGKIPQKIEVEPGLGFAFPDANIPKETELICFTQTETSAGTSVPMEEIYKIKNKYPERLITLDVVSAVPCIEINFSKIDGLFFSVQKGFGLPAGLGVLTMNDECLRKAKKLEEKNHCTGSYHRFSELKKMADKNQTKETPNVLGIYLLGKVTGDMLQIGKENILKDTKEKAKIIYDYFDGHPIYKPFVENRKIRSDTIAVINTPNVSKKIAGKLREKGIIAGTGYKDFKGTQIRIANFPAHSVEDINNLLQEFKNL
jgi:phosphoserine aminotransferase